MLYLFQIGIINLRFDKTYELRFVLLTGLSLYLLQKVFDGAVPISDRYNKLRFDKTYELRFAVLLTGLSFIYLCHTYTYCKRYLQYSGVP